MFCQQCGQEIDNDSKVCKYCGAPVGGGIDPFDNTPPPVSQPVVRAPAPSANRSSIVLGILSIVFCAIGFWFFGIPLSSTAIIMSIIGLVMGVSYFKVTRSPAGIILNVIGLIAGLIELPVTIYVVMSLL